MRRIEKEKAQAKAEADDLRGQLDHIGKGKVRVIAGKKLSLSSSTVVDVFVGRLTSQ